MVFLNGLTGQASFAGGKVVFNSDGTVNIGNGKFTVDKNGNVTINNLTMNNITANSGTFQGKINANNGIQFPCQSLSGNTGTIKNNVTFVTIKPNYDQYMKTFYFPSNPNTGQLLIVKNISKDTQIQIDGNGHKIYCDTTGGVDTYDYTDYYFRKVWLSYSRCKMFIFDGSCWQQVCTYDF